MEAANETGEYVEEGVSGEFADPLRSRCEFGSLVLFVSLRLTARTLFGND